MNKLKEKKARLAHAAGLQRKRWVLAAVSAVVLLVFLAGCATTVTHRYERRPLGEGEGRYLIYERAVTGEEGTTRSYFSRFYSTSGFHGSLTLEARKTIAPQHCTYAIVLEFQGPEDSGIRALAVRVDGTAYRLTDEHPIRTRVLVGGLKVQERFTFPLDLAEVASLKEAGTIQLNYGGGTVNLTTRQQSILRRFLQDTAALGDCGS